MDDPGRTIATTSRNSGMATHRKSVSISIITSQNISAFNDKQTSDHHATEVTEQPTNHPAKKDVRFWGIMVAICIASLLGGLETTVVTTSLPTIVNELKIGSGYVWITNVLFLTSTAMQPLFGQLANIFGRRWLALSIVGVHTLGSGICGGANNGTTLIVGRSIQGIGTGGLNMILDIILSDLVPLRERGTYIAITLVAVTIGTSMGPFIGGAIVDSTTWRWVFYINLPVGGLSFVLLFIFLRVEYQRDASMRKRLQRIDYIGNAILMASTTALLYALTYGGSRYSWSSTKVILPLVFGLCGLVGFAAFECSGLAQEPVIPRRLFGNRTAVVVLVNTFIGAALLYWAVFCLPIYFQGVLVSSPTRAGVQMLPVVVVTVLGAVVSVIVLARYGRYKMLHISGFGIGTIGLGLFSTFDQSSSMSQWIIYQILTAVGTGMLVNTHLPAYQAAQLESDQATATATWAFIRSFGCIWGVTIPAAIFNNQLEKTSSRILDSKIRSDLAAGQAYGRATKAYINQFQGSTRQQIIGSFANALRFVWLISLAFSGLAFLLALIERDIPLRTELESEFGLEQTKADGRAQDRDT
ncbi:hypothetical protein Q7P37_009673 [Cladosporium fusiforme]